MPVTVSTADKQPPVTVSINIQGYPMDEAKAREFAFSMHSELCYRLGMRGEDAGEMLTVEVTADPAPPSTPVTPESPDDSPAESPAMATAAEIAAMTPDQYKAAKAAGRV